MQTGNSHRFAQKSSRPVRLSWVPLNLDDDGLAELDDFEAEGFFHRLFRAVARHHRLADDESALARILHCDPRKVRRLWPRVRHLFITGDGWVRHRAIGTRRAGAGREVRP